MYKNLKPHSIVREVELSLKRLSTDYIDLYQTHWQDATTPIDVTMEALTRLKAQGKIRAIGVSNITVEQLRQYGPIASAQEKFSLIDRGIVTRGIVDYCVAHSVAILSYFTLEQGLLTGTMDPGRQFATGDVRKNDPKFSPENRRKMLSHPLVVCADRTQVWRHDLAAHDRPDRFPAGNHARAHRRPQCQTGGGKRGRRLRDAGRGGRCPHERQV